MHEFQLMSLYWYNIITQNLGFILGFTFGVVHYMVLGKCIMTYGLPWCSAGKESTCNAGDPDSIPGSGRSPGERIGYPLQYSWASLVAQTVKNPPAIKETWVQFLGWEDPLERAWQPTPVFLPGESPRTEEPGGLQSMGSQKVRHGLATKHSIAQHIMTCIISLILAYME